jgi:hypothetical protein
VVSSFELHLRAEKKSPKTDRTYIEVAQWMAAEYLLKSSDAQVGRSAPESQLKRRDP